MTTVPIETCDACLRRGLLLGFVAPRMQAVLDNRRGTPSAILALGDRELIKALGDVAGAHRFLDDFDSAAARTLVETAGLQAVCRHSGAYPRSLFDLDDHPAVLFGAGRVTQALEAVRTIDSVAVVGSRRASVYGLTMARTLGREIAAAGLPVVSGLALGVDAAAHEGAPAVDGMCVAVLGGGADVPYPRTNHALYHRICQNGAVLSEMPPGQRPFRWGFPARNRIMAGLASATLVVEAAPRSGSLITSEYASDLGRVVAAVPGQATSRGARGSNDLLRHGAPLIEEARDLLDEMFGVGVGPGGTARGPGRVDDEAERAPAEARPGDALRDGVLEGVEKGWSLDRMCEVAGITVAEVRVVLSRLEASGLVARDGLGSYSRTGVGTM